MTITILDPRTGKKVVITVPDPPSYRAETGIVTFLISGPTFRHATPVIVIVAVAISPVVVPACPGWPSVVAGLVVNDRRGDKKAPIVRERRGITIQAA
jgi:hypothetical protein